MRAVLIPADPSSEVRLVDVGHRRGLDWVDLVSAIAGPCEYIERVRCTLSPHHNLVLVVDESGQFNGQPVNDRAWALYPVPDYTMRGNVLVMAEGLTSDGVDFVDLPDPTHNLLTVVNALARTR